MKHIAERRSRYIGMVEASQLYGIDLTTLRRRVAQGRLSVFRDPRDERFKLLERTEVDALFRRPVMMG